MAISEGLAEHLLLPPQAGLVVSIITELLYDPASALRGVLPKEREAGTATASWTCTVMAVVCTRAGGGIGQNGWVHEVWLSAHEGASLGPRGKAAPTRARRGRTLKTFAAAGASHKRPRAAGLHASGMSRQANPWRQNVDQRLLKAEGGGGAGKSLLLGMG